MAILAVAKRHAERRRSESGAAMFIVALTLAVLASVGVYALAAASNEVRTSGNERQNAQTHYLAQYGILAASQVLVSTTAQLYLGVMLSNPDVNCVSLPGVPATADPMTRACRRMGSSELALNWASPPFVPYVASSSTPGSLGFNPTVGDFFVEFTGPTMANAPPRYALGLQFCFVQFTATSTGITQPQYVSSGTTSAYYGGEGLEVERARLLAGPVQCPR